METEILESWGGGRSRVWGEEINDLEKEYLINKNGTNAHEKTLILILIFKDFNLAKKIWNFCFPRVSPSGSFLLIHPRPYVFFFLPFIDGHIRYVYTLKKRKHSFFNSWCVSPWLSMIVILAPVLHHINSTIWIAGHDVPHTTHTTARENYEMCGLDWIGPTDLFICLNWRGNEIVWFENIRYKVRKLIL